MINYPVTYQRNFKNDFPKVQNETESLWERCKKYALAALPLFSLYRPFRGPLSLAMSSVRSVTHATQMIEDCKQGHWKEGSLHFLQSTLAIAAVAFFFFNPVYCFLISSVGDILTNLRNLVTSIQTKNIQGILETLAFLCLDILLIVSICYGAIEITVACMILQIALDMYGTASNVYQGNYFEAVCQCILGIFHIRQAIPQIKLLQWTLEHNPVLTAELKQDEKGFVYLDIPDEYLYSLYETFGDDASQIPPYFGKGRAGAHVSVVLIEELKARGCNLQDIGKKFSFRIAHVDRVGDGIDIVALSSPELEDWRVRNGFAPKIHGHDFHITFGVIPFVKK